VFNIPAINQTTARSPVKFEDALGVRDGSAVERQGLVSGLRCTELDEAIAGVADDATYQ
jgi:hypothetical protein